MGLLIVDENKCKKDRICVGECPMAIIKLKDGDGFPELVPGGDEMCLVCGHCVAVCPHGAMSHDQVQIEDSPTIDKKLIIDEHQAVQFFGPAAPSVFSKMKPRTKRHSNGLLK